MLPAIEKMLVRASDSVQTALEVIDRNAQGICFAITDEGVLAGSLTDGDIRRGFLKGVTLDHVVSEIMQASVVSLPVDTPLDVIQRNLTKEIRYIPLVDQNRRPVDYACSRRLHRIPVLEPVLGGNELEYVTDCIRTNWVSSQGSYVRRFESMFAEYVEMPHALATSNGTSALHLALESLGVGPGDEVLVPDFTFAASINAVIHAGATPVLVDIHPETWTIDPVEAEKAITSNTQAIMPVHIYGHPCHMDEIMALAKDHGLLVIEDCAEALGTKYKGRCVGNFGDASAFSFFGNKIITTGEGGMALFRDNSTYERCKILRDHGMSAEKRYWHEMVGYNYRMTNLQAALGVAQMEQLDTFIATRKRISQDYLSRLSDIPEIKPQPLASWAESSYWLFTVLVGKESRLSRDELIDKLLLNGIESRTTFYPLHQMLPYRKFTGTRHFPISTLIASNGLSLPSAVSLQVEDIEFIIEKLSDFLRSYAHVNGL